MKFSIFNFACATLLIALVAYVNCKRAVYYSCDFKKCDLENQTGSRYIKWTSRQGKSTQSGTGPFGDHTTISANGNYSYTAGYISRYNTGRYKASTPGFTLNPGKCALMTFWYYAHDRFRRFGAFNVSVLQSRPGLSGSTVNETGWSFDGKDWMRWRMGAVKIQNTANEQKQYKVVFEATRRQYRYRRYYYSSYYYRTEGVIAIDDILIKEMECNEAIPNTTIMTNFTCDFQNGTCGFWKNEKWVRKNGGTPTYNTGPSYDNTYGSYQGYYIYFEADGGAPKTSARLISPEFHCSTGCGLLTFFYHAQGSALGNLTVQLMANKTIKTLWSISGKDVYVEGNTNPWKHVVLPILGKGGFRVMFKASKGNGVQGDYALDDIIISQETCTQLDSLWKGDFTPSKSPRVLTGMWGQIASPNFPDVFHRGDNQTWIIKATPKKYVRILISRLSFRITNNKLYVDDVPYTGTLQNKLIFINKTTVNVTLTATDEIAFLGFELYWKSTDIVHGDIKVLQEPGGVLSYTSVPNKEWDQWWVLDMSPNDRYNLQLDIQEITMTGTKCNQTFVKIYRGSFDSSHQIRSYCNGFFTENKIYVGSPHAIVQLQMENSSASVVSVYIGFSVGGYQNVTTPPTGTPQITTEPSLHTNFSETLTKPFGIITNPWGTGYSRYNLNSRYEWIITSNTTAKVLFNVTYYNFYYSYSSSYAHLMIGGSRIYNRRYITKNISPGRSIHVLFTSYAPLYDSYYRNLYGGFSIYYMKTSRLSSVETQIIQLPSIAYVPFDTSQLSTSFYQLGSQEYWWLLNVPYVFNIVLDIEEFKIQSSTAECVENNSLKIYAGDATDSLLLGTYCGTNIPRTLNISGNSVMGFFRSHPSGSTPSGNILKFTWMGYGNGSGEDARIYRSNFGVLHSPNWPGYYPSYTTERNYIITNSKYILVYFTKFDLQTCCSFLTLNGKRVYPGNQYYYYSYRYYVLNNSSAPIHIKSSRLVVEFKSTYQYHYYRRYRGFEMFFKATNDTAASGQMMFLTGDCQYLHSFASHPVDQVWLVRVTGRIGNPVKITFGNISMPACNNDTDFIRIYSRFPTSASYLDSLVGFTTHCNARMSSTTTLYSDTFMIWFKLKSASPYIQRGFSLYWRRQNQYPCQQQGRVTYNSGEYGVIKPQVKGSHTWLVDVFPSHFAFFKFKQNSLYKYDKLYINGSEYGLNYNNGILIEDNYVNVTFIPGPSMYHSSFELLYKGTNSTWGNLDINFVDAKDTQTLMTPNYPSAYSPYMDYMYVISAPPRTSMQFIVEDIRMGPNCAEDYVRIIDGGMYTRSHTKQIKYCGFGAQKSFTTSSNSAVLMFHTGIFSSFNNIGMKLKISLTGTLATTVHPMSNTGAVHGPTARSKSGDNSQSNPVVWIVPVAVVTVVLGVIGGVLTVRRYRKNSNNASTGMSLNSGDVFTTGSSADVVYHAHADPSQLPGGIDNPAYGQLPVQAPSALKPTEIIAAVPNQENSPPNETDHSTAQDTGVTLETNADHSMDAVLIKNEEHPQNVA